jgi:hypothetical protein
MRKDSKTTITLTPFLDNGAAVRTNLRREQGVMAVKSHLHSGRSSFPIASGTLHVCEQEGHCAGGKLHAHGRQYAPPPAGGAVVPPSAEPWLLAQPPMPRRTKDYRSGWPPVPSAFLAFLSCPRLHISPWVATKAGLDCRRRRCRPKPRPKMRYTGIPSGSGTDDRAGATWAELEGGPGEHRRRI